MASSNLPKMPECFGDRLPPPRVCERTLGDQREVHRESCRLTRAEACLECIQDSEWLLLGSGVLRWPSRTGQGMHKTQDD